VSPAQRKLSANVALLSVALATVALVRFPPTEYSFYRRCPIFASLHVLCPGCGATRALAALLRLQILEALDRNALAVFMLPLIAAFLVQCYRRAIRPSNFEFPPVPEPWLRICLAATTAFTIFRNIHFS